MRTLIYAALVVVALYLCGVGLLFLFQRTLIYPAPQGPQPMPAGFENVSLKTADKLTIKAAWHPGAPDKPTIIFFHGNGDSLPGAAEATKRLAKAGYGILLADYRGYGENPGEPTEAGLMRDGRAALAFVRQQGIEPERLVIMGASLGTGIATQLATEQSPAALVLVSPYTRLPDVAAAVFPWAPTNRLMLDRFDSIDKMDKIRAPVLVLHARNDKVIPYKQGVALAEALPESTLLSFDDEGHQLQFTAPAQTATIAWLEARGL